MSKINNFRRIPFFFPVLSAVLLLLSGRPAPAEDDYRAQRAQMVETQIRARGITDEKVLHAMGKVPRHRFVPKHFRSLSYGDGALPIGMDQTISQPYIVAYMTEALGLRPEDRILEIGTGSGYQAAILAEIAKSVYTIEIIKELGEIAKETLASLGYKNVHVLIGDGYKGWPEKAPFDAVIVTCAPEKIPEALVQQLKEGGRIMIPVGKEAGIQKLVKVTKKQGRIQTEGLLDVRFVPMVKGKAP